MSQADTTPKLADNLDGFYEHHIISWIQLQDLKALEFAGSAYLEDNALVLPKVTDLCSSCLYAQCVAALKEQKARPAEQQAAANRGCHDASIAKTVAFCHDSQFRDAISTNCVYQKSGNNLGYCMKCGKLTCINCKQARYGVGEPCTST